MKSCPPVAYPLGPSILISISLSEAAFLAGAFLAGAGAAACFGYSTSAASIDSEVTTLLSAMIKYYHSSFHNTT